MKRSEAVTKLGKYLMVMPITNNVWKDADYILGFIEHIGMKPPFSNEVFQEQANIYIEADGNQWDPEEKK